MWKEKFWNRMFGSQPKASSCPQTVGDGDDNRVEFDEESAQSLLENGEVQKGLALAEDVLEKHPKHPEALAIKASAFMFMGQNDGAERVLSKALKDWPENVSLLIRMGCVYNVLKRFDEAQRQFKLALAVDSENWRALQGLADALAYSLDYRAALQTYDRAIKSNPGNGMAWIGQALALYRLKKYEDALQSLDKGIELFPRHPNAARLRRVIMDAISD